MGFAPQVEALIHQIRPDRQFVMFSATFPPSMESLARKVLRKPVEIIVGGRASVAPEITQIVEIREQASKFNRLIGILGEQYESDADERTLIFVERQEAADELLGAILKKGYACGSIHGGKDQVDRSSTIDDFKAGVIPIVVATSVAARGLDVKQLSLVINYDVPSHLEDYVHRAGRTGRAGQTGTCITFITPEQEKHAPDLVKALKRSEKPVPEDLQKMADDFLVKVKEGKAKGTSLGFGGKGMEKFDAARDLERGILRKQFGGEDTKEDKIKDDAKAILPEAVIYSAADALKQAKEDEVSSLDNLLNGVKIHKRAPAPAYSKPGGSSDAFERAKLAASRLGDRLTRPNALRAGQSVDNRGPDAGDYHTRLEINQLPQKSRWAVTNRSNVKAILDETGVSITTKGEFIAPGKASGPPGPNDAQPLYLLVEGSSEHDVMHAMQELIRLARDGVVADLESQARNPKLPGGRYKPLI